MIKFKRQDKVFRPGILCMVPAIVIGSMLLISYFFFLSSFAMAAEAVGKFKHVEGKVDILREGAFPAITVKVQDQVYPRDIIRTKSASKAEIIFKDNTVLQIAQRSRIDISEYYTGDTGKNVIKLSRGQVKAVVDKNVTKRISLAPDANRFEIHTPNAVAGVRGTEFHVAYDRNVTTVLLREGNVCVFNLKAQENVVCLPPNYIVTVTGVMIPQPPRKATDTEIKIFEKETAPNVPVSKTFPETATELLVADRGIVPDGINKPDRQSISPETIALNETPTNITDIPIMIPMNIPAFEVGRTNLSGSLIAGSESFDYVSVIMNNVAFFAPSTGEKPGIWATNNVTGQYDFSHGNLIPATIINADNVIAISNGNGISADFQFTSWNSSNKTWTSAIKNGTGTLSGGSYNGPVTFRGAGAGTLTGTNSGSLSGTAAGIVK